MIVVDTNVVSEPLRHSPDPRVLTWLEDHADEVAITSVTVSELLYGAQRLPRGRRRSGLLTAIERLIDGAGDSLLAFDGPAARVAADLRIASDRAGRPTSTEDIMIAATASVHHAALATRNVRDFEAFGISLINPWG